MFAESLEIALTLEGYDVRRAVLPTSGQSTALLLGPILRFRPRVVLLDLDLGRFGNGIRLIGPLSSTGIAVVIVTASTDEARWGEALRYGARKVLTKSAPLNDILATVRKINDGRAVVTREEHDQLIHVWHKNLVEVHDLRDRLERLTRREAEVLGQLMTGHQVRAIAQRSVVSEATVRTQVKSILAKLQVSSQLAAVGIAHQADWGPPQTA
ncbi:MAG: LuxR family transcriptional regulator [Marmoricola sp.]|nr:LuxR family transcriptional regulator [Marmoricola sp.]